MTTSQTHVPVKTDALVTVTRRGRLVPAMREGSVELDISGERFELLGPFDNAALNGDDVEVVGVIAPLSRVPGQPPALLVRSIQRL